MNGQKLWTIIKCGEALAGLAFRVLDLADKTEAEYLDATICAFTDIRDHAAQLAQVEPDVDYRADYKKLAERLTKALGQ
jgi:uncharacterized membrane protein YfbV (UPF0208 family)